MEKERVELLQRVCKNEEKIAKKTREIEQINNENKKIQDECHHPILVCLDKNIHHLGYDKLTNYHIECLICKKRIISLSDKYDIDLTEIFSDVSTNNRRIELRRQLARDLYLNSVSVINKENDCKVLVKK